MDVDQRKEKPNIAGDRLNILLLTYLYMLQCLPRGLSDGISIVLQKRNVSYKDQAEFSLISYSYCFKLLWSPIVDCIYSKRVGRRKTWTVPTQYLIGIFLLFISMNLDSWLGSEDGTQKPKPRLLGLIFFSCIFLASTQDIAVDGWSLTMLKKRNVGHAGTCNNVGYSMSQVLGYVLFIVLESKEFCNKFRSVPLDHGFITYSGFVFFWSMVFLVSSTFILIFKRDNSLDSIDDDSDCRLGLKESYIGLAPVNGVARLKLIDAGVPSDKFALLTVPSLPFTIILPLVFGRFVIGDHAMRTYTLTYVWRSTLTIVYAVFIYFTPLVKDANNALPNWHYWVLVFLHNADVISENVMYTALYAFISRISDPRFGGMYVTLLGAVSSVGYRWPVSVCLWSVDLLTIRSCALINGTEKCHVILDGFFTEVALCTFVAVLWLYWAKRKIYELEDMDVSEWILKTERNGVEDSKLLSKTVAHE